MNIKIRSKEKQRKISTIWFIWLMISIVAGLLTGGHNIPMGSIVVAVLAGIIFIFLCEKDWIEEE